ncbi:uncharacterized protein LOC108843561 [Raphanus sativus]|uniref:Uncharacterized protein LOC108843561 n=1 Tax=Raphanus sativus TaxID=3726 RepID=A0A6J0MK63_RAPSA|nr:uncharacterized protein LOC108843561 [Raphanus sativus]
MSNQLDKALKHMTLEEEEEPFVLPDRPEFFATERNSLSLIGRLLNPHCQRMSDLIMDMPRKWKLYNRVRGVALSPDRFQFIFKFEQDLLEVLSKVHTHNSWAIVLERWVERPPDDYLQHILVWVQMRNIPVNHYTPETIEALGEFAGHVVDVPYDPEKAQVKDYVRVLVKFDVSKPLRRFKKLTLPGGEVVNIRYDYERLQKRCYTCQRLTHEQERCPWVIAEKQGGAKGSCSSAESKNTELVSPLEESDPLYGVLATKHLGLDPVYGRPKIAEEVLDGMRQYLRAAEGPEKMARIERVKKSLDDLENDPLGQKMFLRLEAAPVVSTDLDKGKGVVFDFKAQADNSQVKEKFMAGAIVAGAKTLQSGKVISFGAVNESTGYSDLSSSRLENPTGYSAGVLHSSASGTIQKKTKQRKRPGTYTRRAAGKKAVKQQDEEVKTVGEGVMSDGKRKAQDDVEPSQSSARFKKPLVVPTEGPSNI